MLAEVHDYIEKYFFLHSWEFWPAQKEWKDDVYVIIYLHCAEYRIKIFSFQKLLLK